MQIVNPTVVNDPNFAYVNANLGLRNNLLSPFASTLAEGAAKGLSNLVFGPSLDDQLKQVKLREANNGTLDQIFRESGEGHARQYAQNELGMDEEEAARTMARLHDNARLSAQRGVHVSQAQAQDLPVNIASEEKAKWDPSRSAPAAPGQPVSGGASPSGSSGGGSSEYYLPDTMVGAPKPPQQSSGNPSQDLTGAAPVTSPGQPPAPVATPAAVEATPAFFPSGEQSTVEQRKAFAENIQKAPQAIQELSQSVTPKTMMAYHAQTARLIGALGMMKASTDQDPTKMSTQVAMLASMTQDNYQDFLNKIQLESGIATDGLKKLGLQGVADSNIWVQMQNPQTAEHLRATLGPEAFSALQKRMPEIAERVARAGLSPMEQALITNGIIGGALGGGPEGIKNAEIAARAAAITSQTRRAEDIHPAQVRVANTEANMADVNYQLAKNKSPLILEAMEQGLDDAKLDHRTKEWILGQKKRLDPYVIQEADLNIKNLSQQIAQSSEKFNLGLTGEQINQAAGKIGIQAAILKAKSAPTDALASKEALNYEATLKLITDSQNKIDAARLKVSQGLVIGEAAQREVKEVIDGSLANIATLHKVAEGQLERRNAAAATSAGIAGAASQDMEKVYNATFENPRSTVSYWEQKLPHGIGLGTPMAPNHDQIGLVVDVASIGAQKGIKLSHEQFLSEIRKKYGSQMDRNNVVTPNALWMIYEKQYEDARKRK